MNGLKRFVMFFNLILQPKDCSGTSLRRTSLSARIIAGIARNLLLEAVQSPTFAPRFKPMFSLDVNVADSEPYKALAELARVANKWLQFKRNLPSDGGKGVLKQLARRHLDLAHPLKTDPNHNTLLFWTYQQTLRFRGTS